MDYIATGRKSAAPTSRVHGDSTNDTKKDRIGSTTDPM